MKNIRLEKIESIVTPVVIGMTVAAAAVVSLVQIRRENARRRRWMIPLLIIGGLVLAGFVGAIVEYAVLSQPKDVCDKNVTALRYENDPNCHNRGNNAIQL